MTSDNIDLSPLQELKCDGDLKRASLMWTDLVPLILSRLDTVIRTKYDARSEPIKDPLTGTEETVEEVAERVKGLLRTQFAEEPPFTVQRLCELLLDPEIYYPRTAVEKLLSALERVLSVSSAAGDYPKLDIQEELRKEGGGHELQNGEGSHKGIVLSEISWIVDTGTPPPDTIDEPLEKRIKLDTSDDKTSEKKEDNEEKRDEKKDQENEKDK
ncbi:hypothetical protein TRVA0_011S02608 [Trichomonascus vanleenenianus]|uniref:uncharacterized protein n=1 Tax=Trichomonascus vanleenenianus TaxID=2268995 RepID=UPI003EC9DF4E